MVELGQAKLVNLVSILTAPFVQISSLSGSSGISRASHKFIWVAIEVIVGGVLSF